MSIQLPDWQKAEALVGGHLKALGLKNVRFTPRGADGGVDLLADGVAAEVKFRQNKASRTEIQRLHGEVTRRGVEGIFYSLSGYSAPAKEYADETRISLFQLHEDGTATAINVHARKLELGRQTNRFPTRSEDIDPSQVQTSLPPAPPRTGPLPPAPLRPQVGLPVRQSKWSWLTVNGRWYFYLTIGSVGALGFIPFIHAAVKRRNRKYWGLAAFYGVIAVFFLTASSILRPPGRDEPVSEPAYTALVVFMVAATVSACILLTPIRRQVHNLDRDAPSPSR